MVAQSSSPAAGGPVRYDFQLSSDHASPVQRETIESIAVAVILAFLFRAFVAEAFIIPTGSMAPTLLGMHKDIICQQCGYEYFAGASGEESEEDPETVVAATCPMCRYRTQLDIFNNLDHDTFSGDRILVSKFSYDVGDPKRWDVIVFKWPNNAKQNYIKRLVGLPGETIFIWHGDIYYRSPGVEDFEIARKPPHKIKAMLQDVYNSAYVPTTIHKAGLPIRWQPDNPAGDAWETDDFGSTYAASVPADQEAWIRYRHILPTDEDWQRALNGESIDPDGRDGQLITDFYAYNAHIDRASHQVTQNTYDPNEKIWDLPEKRKGLFWVGDLALECDLDVESDTGEVLLDLVEGGRHHRCRIDIATGKATLAIDDGNFPLGEDADVMEVHGQTGLRGPGSYRLRFSNLDDQLTLWVDERVVEFDGPATYVSPENERPVWSPEDPGDLAPAGVGARGAKLQVNNLNVMRDIYYVASRSNEAIHEYADAPTPDMLRETFRDPESWAQSSIFEDRQPLHFTMLEDQFFPMGDNSPHSYDARSWLNVNYVERKLLIGKALFVYWPHPLYHPIPFFPNFKRMGLIR